MPSIAVASHNPTPAPRENLLPVLSELRRDHSRHVENFPAPSLRKTGKVKWHATKKNFTYVTMADGQDVFLHQDDFDGDWPPPYHKSVEFDLLENNHPRCKFRAKEARLLGAR